MTGSRTPVSTVRVRGKTIQIFVCRVFSSNVSQEVLVTQMYLFLALWTPVLFLFLFFLFLFLLFLLLLASSSSSPTFSFLLLFFFVAFDALRACEFQVGDAQDQRGISSRRSCL
jgi:hypothetical protein